MTRPFADRTDAGRQLAELLRDRVPPDSLVLGLPRGGVVVAAEVARALGTPLNALAVRKVGVPGHSELALAAVASGGTVAVNDDIVRRYLRRGELQELITTATAALERAESAWRPATCPPAKLAARSLILVDDGIATGATAEAAIRAAIAEGASSVILASPVAPPETVRRLRKIADDVVTLLTPFAFGAVGSWYREFDQTPDDTVRALLEAGAC